MDTSIPKGFSLTNLSHNKTSPKWTFNSRLSGSKSWSTPGPGSYTSVTSKYRPPSWQFGTLTRDSRGIKDAPGPGQYMPEKPKFAGSQYTFSSGKRSSPADFSPITPGPGQYKPEKPRLAASKVQYSWGSGQRGVPGDGSPRTPGPGSYAPDFKVTRSQAPKYTASVRREHFMETATRPDTPGPGSYRSLDEPSKSPKWGFGSPHGDSRDGGGRSPGSPGPGAYSIDPPGSPGPKYTMRSRPPSGGQKETPGPGSFGLCTSFG